MCHAGPNCSITRDMPWPTPASDLPLTHVSMMRMSRSRRLPRPGYCGFGIGIGRGGLGGCG